MIHEVKNKTLCGILWMMHETTKNQPSLPADILVTIFDEQIELKDSDCPWHINTVNDQSLIVQSTTQNQKQSSSTPTQVSPQTLKKKYMQWSKTMQYILIWRIITQKNKWIGNSPLNCYRRKPTNTHNTMPKPSIDVDTRLKNQITKA